jgi:DNA-binding response OmpR family regulator
VYESSGGQKTFTPLLEEFINEEIDTELPVMERRLLTLLLANHGKVVNKDKIFDTVWKETDGIASEWSLNSLVYRLRNHPGFDKSRFLIKSVKKVGYVLYDSHEE